jgi:hypothetical protein
MGFDKQRLPGARPPARVSTADIVGRREADYARRMDLNVHISPAIATH